MDEKNKIFYERSILKEDYGIVREWKPFEVGEIPTPPHCENHCETPPLFESHYEINKALLVGVKLIINAKNYFAQNPHGRRLAHLAIHSKKRRTRKKNTNRIKGDIIKRIRKGLI